MKFFICLIFIAQYIAAPVANADILDHILHHHSDHVDQSMYASPDLPDEAQSHHENDHEHKIIDIDKVALNLKLESEEIELKVAPVLTFSVILDDVEKTSDTLSLISYNQHYSPPNGSRTLPLLI